MNIFQKIADWFIQTSGKIKWSPGNLLTTSEQNNIKELLKNNYYVILTRRNNHLSTYFISIASLFLSGKWSYWGHALFNAEDAVTNDSDFRVIEAIGTGVSYTPFDRAFDVNGVVLLKPKSMSVEQWTGVLDKAKTELGKPYDTLFDLTSDKALSCVELIRVALKAEPNYDADFANFEKMIKEARNLTPQMIYDCPDFEVVFEIRR